MATSKNYTKDDANWYMSDFETITPNTDYFKTFNDTGIVLAVARPLLKKHFKNKYKHFINIEDYFDWIEDGESKTIFFHNLDWDSSFILSEAEKRGYNFNFDANKKITKRLEVFKIGNNVVAIYLMLRKRVGKKVKDIKVIFRCTYRLFMDSVENLGKCVNMDKYQMVKHKDTFYDVEPVLKIDELDPDYVRYCEQDCDIICEVWDEIDKAIHSTPKIQEWEKEHGDFIMAHFLTSASLSMGVFKRCYFEEYRTNPEEPVDRLTIPKYLYDEFKQAYSGGLTQYSNKYNKNVNVKKARIIDIVSSYPSVLVEQVPTEYVWVRGGNLPPKELNYVTWVKVSLENVKIKKDWRHFPLLGEKGFGTKKVEERSKLDLFTLKEEFELLQNMYDWEVVSYEEIYSITTDYTKEFIKDFYHYKEMYKAQGKKAMAHFYKIVINSFYGKFGQKPDFPTTFYSENDYNKTDKVKNNKNKNFQILIKSHSMFDIGKYKQYVAKQDKENNRANNIIVAAFATSKARIKLLNMMLLIGPENLLYCDTDSIFFIETKSNWKKVKPFLGSELGQWEIETFKTETGKQYDYFDTFASHCSKKYVCSTNGEVVKAGTSGIRKEIIKNPDGSYNSVIITDKLKYGIEDFVIENATLQQKLFKSGKVLLPVNKSFKLGHHETDYMED